MAYRGEDLERAVETLLQAQIGAALTAAATRWAAIDPVTLDEPQTWHRGYQDLILEFPSTSYPYVVIQAPLRRPVEGKGGLGEQPVKHDLAISIFVLGDTPAEANTVAHRYAEAVVAVLQANQVVSGFTQQNYEPKAEIVAGNITHQKAGTSGDMYNEDDIDYMRYVHITQTMEYLD